MTDERYKPYKYSSQDGKNNPPSGPRMIHKQFNINGKFSLDGLESLTNQGWRRLYPRLPEHRTDPEETWVYASKNSLLIVYANYEKDYHDVDLGTYPEIFEEVKLNIEKNLECKLNDKKENLSNLTENIGSN
jgi:hypothetical protein